MKNKFLNGLTQKQLEVLEPIMYDTLQVKMNKRAYYNFINDVINKGSDLRNKPEFVSAQMSDDFVRDMAKEMIKAGNLDVNVSFGPDEEDLMFYAMLHGDDKDVQMLIDAGYNGTNLIKDCTVKCYFPEKTVYDRFMDKKYKLIKSMPEIDLASEFAKKRKSESVKYIEALDKAKKLKTNQNLDRAFVKVDYEVLQEINKRIPQFRTFIEACDVMTYNEEKVLNRIRKEMVAVTNSEKIVDAILEGKKTDLTDSVVNSFLKRFDVKYSKGINYREEMQR